MSAVLPETVAAVVGGATVNASILVRFDFESGTERVWQGFWELTAGGETWRPMGVLGTVDGIAVRSDLTAESLTFTLSGVDAAMIAIAKNSAVQVKNKSCAVYVQFFDADWKTLDQPVALRSGIMDQMTYTATGPASRTIKLTAEGLFVARNAAPFAYYTDRDQKARYAGDGFFKLVSTLIVKQITWPDF